MDIRLGSIPPSCISLIRRDVSNSDASGSNNFQPRAAYLKSWRVRALSPSSLHTCMTRT